ncbi:Fc receptor-like protein 2 [Lemur catta]|uniref:Fc receptor-like protein 2 n=1 Tax=Lemur catta TaxID=9447 RepID=UPI001E269C19|nr:Fc receptor-like protein 2 [Lemur catta]
MLLWSLLVILAPASAQADGLTLLAPSSVFEGDRIVLSCQEEKKRKIKTITYYKDETELLSLKKFSNFPIQRANFSDSGNYHCTATVGLWSWKETSQTVNIKVQELFRHPVLTASSFQPTEGGPLTLTCETRLPPQKSGVRLQFRFFRDDQALGSGWSRSAELHIPAMKTEDSGSYRCEAETLMSRIRKWSPQSQIHVQRIPISNVSLETQVPGGQVIEGGKLDLLCSVAEGTGDITFSWHREATGPSLGKKTQRSLTAELDILAVRESDAGGYYCTADNGHEPIQSKLLNILVRIPVSSPVLTITAPRAPAMVGDVVELHCEALRGSPPIVYQFYDKDVSLGNSSAPSGGGVSFNLSLTAEYSGNYSCEADNGLGAQRSEVVTLSISEADGCRGDLVIARALGGLFGVLAFTGGVVLFYHWSHKISGKSSATNTPRGVSSPNPQASTQPSPLFAMEDLQPEYVNVGSVGVDVIYSEVMGFRQPEDSANTRRPSLENKDSQVIYSSVKK